MSNYKQIAKEDSPAEEEESTAGGHLQLENVKQVVGDNQKNQIEEEGRSLLSHNDDDNDHEETDNDGDSSMMDSKGLASRKRKRDNRKKVKNYTERSCDRILAKIAKVSMLLLVVQIIAMVGYELLTSHINHQKAQQSSSNLPPSVSTNVEDDESKAEINETNETNETNDKHETSAPTQSPIPEIIGDMPREGEYDELDAKNNEKDEYGEDLGNDFVYFAGNKTKTDELIEDVNDLPVQATSIKFASNVKIVNLGLPKTGTSSFMAAMSQTPIGRKARSHYNCRHWQNRNFVKAWRSFAKTHDSLCVHQVRCGPLIYAASQANMRPLDLIDPSYRVFAQIDCMDSHLAFLPQMELFDQMLESYDPSEIVFALTTRTTESWVDSVDRWGTLQQRITHGFAGKTIHGHTFPEVKVKKHDKKAQQALVGELKDFHEERVRRLARKHGFLLIELDISQPKYMLGNFTTLAIDVLNTKANPAELRYAWANANGLDQQEREKEKQVLEQTKQELEQEFEGEQGTDTKSSTITTIPATEEPVTQEPATPPAQETVASTKKGKQKQKQKQKKSKVKTKRPSEAPTTRPTKSPTTSKPTKSPTPGPPTIPPLKGPEYDPDSLKLKNLKGRPSNKDDPFNPELAAKATQPKKKLETPPETSDTQDKEEVVDDVPSSSQANEDVGVGEESQTEKNQTETDRQQKFPTEG